MTETELEAISIRRDGRYRVSFRSGDKTFDRSYERILLTLPFSTLRLVKLKVNLPAIKQKAIPSVSFSTRRSPNAKA
ncbi:hypothetical protein [Nostoc sp.]|uniref:hypothetical protein n=1 Tax=Nostoc sp. TaxID=1180 RepID=UPI002FFBE8D8